VSGKVVPLHAQRSEANANSIEVLRTALDRAERGDIVGVVMLVEYSDDTWDTCHTPAENLFDLLGKAEALKHKIVKRMSPESDG
jgi:hypothetical protein